MVQRDEFIRQTNGKKATYLLLVPVFYSYINAESCPRRSIESTPLQDHGSVYGRSSDVVSFPANLTVFVSNVKMLPKLHSWNNEDSDQVPSQGALRRVSKSYWVTIIL